MIVTVLTWLTRTCRYRSISGHWDCRLPYGHATGHQGRPTLREWWSGWITQGREGDER